MNNYQLNISGPEALVLQELLGDRISSLEYDLAEDPRTDFDESAAMEAELNHCLSLRNNLKQLIEDSE